MIITADEARRKTDRANNTTGIIVTIMNEIETECSKGNSYMTMKVPKGSKFSITNKIRQKGFLAHDMPNSYIRVSW